LVLKSYANNS